MLIRLLMVVFCVTLLVIGTSAVVNRGWQETHLSIYTPDIQRATLADIGGAMTVWVAGKAGGNIAERADRLSGSMPFLAKVTVGDINRTAYAIIAPVAESEMMLRITAAVNEAYAILTSGKPMVALAPMTAPAIPVAPAPEKPAPTIMSMVMAAVPGNSTPAPAPAPAMAPPSAKTAAPTPQTPEMPRAELRVTTAATPVQKGCLYGGLTAAGTSLLIGPGEVLAWVTNSPALPTSVRIAGIVLSGAMVSGCAAGALVAPSVLK
ncbi:MAG: hypothetical protein WCF85_02460 [Rhodospirillaceae bacterium]